jgi:GNAT superfamily N-acetyltransferase
MIADLPDGPWPVEAPPDPADTAALRKRLQQSNMARATVEQGQPLGIYLRAEDGELMAGVYGWLWGECLEIYYLWVDEGLRGQGIGRRLIQRIEQEGKERGARLTVLDTFSFQAPGFYERLGYETFGLIEGYGGQHAKHFMRKRLT